MAWCHPKWKRRKLHWKISFQFDSSTGASQTFWQPEYNYKWNWFHFCSFCHGMYLSSNLIRAWHSLCEEITRFKHLHTDWLILTTYSINWLFTQQDHGRQKAKARICCWSFLLYIIKWCHLFVFIYGFLFSCFLSSH